MSGGPIGLYVRVSRKGDREDERFHSPREQAERAAALAAARGFEPGPVFEDIDVSGAVAPAERPAMRELLERIDAGELGGIAAFSLDRLSREPAHGDALVKRVTKAGGVLLTPDIPDAIDSPTGEFTFGMLLQVAKLYRSQAKARFGSAKERAILAGIPVGPVPTGYRLRSDRRLELDPVMAPIVAELYERWNMGEGRVTLARWLMDVTGQTWTAPGVRSIIRRRLNTTGRMTHGDIVSEWDAGAIVDEATWQAAQVARPGARATRSNGSWLLTGLLTCAGCGLKLTPSAQHQRRKTGVTTYRRYRCDNLSCPSRASVQAPRIEAWVLRKTYGAGDEFERLAVTPDLSALEAELVAAERRLEQALAPEAQDALGDTWASTVKARRTERDTKARALGEARRDTGAPAVNLRLRDVWDELDPTARREALGLYWKEIRVGRPAGRGQETPLTFVARGQLGAVELALPEQEQAA